MIWKLWAIILSTDNAVLRLVLRHFLPAWFSALPI